MGKWRKEDKSTDRGEKLHCPESLCIKKLSKKRKENSKWKISFPGKRRPAKPVV
jgi:hypothetical protein